MKFIVLTNPGQDNRFVQELLASKLVPSLIVTDSPFYCREKNPLKRLVRRARLYYRYFRNHKEIERKYSAYFLARKHGIPWWPSDRVNTDAFARRLEDMAIDYGFVFTFRILKEKIFRQAKKGFINFHPAYLPCNRGASPASWVIRDSHETGLTFHYVRQGIDDGPIIERHRLPLSGFETAEILHAYQLRIGALLFVRLIFRLAHQCSIKVTENQVDQGSYQRPFREKDCLINGPATVEAMDKVVRSARTENQVALFDLDGQRYEVINCVHLPGIQSPANGVPHVDPQRNIYVKLRDGETVLLVTR